MKMHFVKELPILLFAMASASTLASLPQVESAWTGVKTVYSERDFGLHILRKAMLVGLSSRHGIQEPLGLDGRVLGCGRLVWKMPESSLSACCEVHGRDRRQDTRIR
jgi:hypothetical protein